jgi:hypothetical protein
MGQSASKGASKAAEKVAKRVMDSAQPRGPPPPPPPSMTSKNASATTTANNPAMFLRGSGVATEDIRDKGQELYLRSLHRVDDEMKAKGPAEMPEDLLKFIQDVGPTKQSVDKEFTAPRLLEKENESELNKVESVRKVTRERIKMPLMGEDHNHTTTRNTNFRNTHFSAQEEATDDFGLSTIQLFQLLSEKEKSGSIESFYESVIEQGDASQWTEEEKKAHKQLLKDATNAMEIPILRMDADGNFFGLHAKDVPGPEVKSIEPIPESKVKLVLQDLIDNEGKSVPVDIASAKLEERRQQRKGTRVSGRQ